MPAALFTKHHKLDWTYNPTKDPTGDTALDYLDEEQIRLFRYNSRKPTYNHPEDENERNLLIHAQYRNVGYVIHCHLKHSTCNRRYYCRTCSNRRAYRLKQKVAHIAPENLHFITISHDNPQKFSSDGYIMNQFFKAYRNRLNSLKKSGLTTLHIVSQEIKVYSLYPKVTVLPHIHIIVQTRDIDRVVSSLSKKHLNIVVKPILDHENFEKVIDYLYKPIQLVDQYAVDFPKHPVQVNRNVTSFIERYPALIQFRQQAYSDFSNYPNMPAADEPDADTSVNVLQDSDLDDVSLAA